MIEIPESITLAKQLNSALEGRRIKNVTAWQNPHKLAFIYGEPENYGNLLEGRSFTSAEALGSWVEMTFEDSVFLISEGTSLLFTVNTKQLPKKHQMLIEFEDGSFLCAYVKMYGGVVCAKKNTYDNEWIIKEKDVITIPPNISRANWESYIAAKIGKTGAYQRYEIIDECPDYETKLIPIKKPKQPKNITLETFI